MDEREAAKQANQAVVDLHKRRWAGFGADPGGIAPGAYCEHCSELKQDYVAWPCQTLSVMALEVP